MSTDAYIVLSVVLGLVVIAVLAVALILVRRGLAAISEGLATLVGRARGRRGRAPAAARAGGEGDQRPVRRDPLRAAGHRAQGGDRGRAEAAMTLWWIGSLVLLLVVFPIVVVLLRGVLEAARSIVPSVEAIADTRGGRVEGPRRRGAAADHPRSGRADRRRGRRVRRLARRDRRRRRREARPDAGGGRGDAGRGGADRARARLLPGLDDPRAAQDRRRARPDDRRRRRDRREERAGERDRRRHQRGSSTPGSSCSRGCW